MVGYHTTAILYDQRAKLRNRQEATSLILGWIFFWLVAVGMPAILYYLGLFGRENIFEQYWFDCIQTHTLPLGNLH